MSYHLKISYFRKLFYTAVNFISSEYFKNRQIKNIQHVNSIANRTKNFKISRVIRRDGRVWFIVAVLKTVVPSSAPWVRIPLPPPN